MQAPAVLDDGRIYRAGVTALAAALVWFVVVRDTQGQQQPATLLLIGLVLSLVVVRPKIAVIAALAAGATLLAPGAYYRSVAGVHTSLAEVFVYGAVGAWLLHRVTNKVAPLPRVPKLLCLLVVFAITGAIVGLSRHVPGSVVHGLVQSFGWYLFVLPACAFFATHTDKVLLERWVLGLCTAGSVVELALLAFGLPVVSDSPVALVIRGRAESLDRVRPSLLELVVLGTVLVVVRVGQEGWSRTRVLRLMVFATVLILSFTRVIWLSTVIAVLVVQAVRPGRRDLLVTLRALVAGAVTASLLYVGAVSGVLGQPGRLAVERAATVFSPDVVHDSSYTYRTKENGFALKAIERDPVRGAGLGKPFGFTEQRYDPRANRVVRVDSYYLHNSYLFAWVALGLGGILSLLAFVVAATRYAIRWVPKLPPDDAVRSLAGAGALLAYGISAIWQPQLFHPASILSLCVAVSLLVRPTDADTA